MYWMCVKVPSSHKDTSWWSGEVKASVKAKRDNYRNLCGCSTKSSLEEHKIDKMETKGVIPGARSIVLEEACKKLDTREEKKHRN